MYNPTWAAIGPDGIEAAYRYELSQDAEELRRLGAVEESFRPLTRAEAPAVEHRPVARKLICHV